jgi:hypothetical protein
VLAIAVAVDGEEEENEQVDIQPGEEQSSPHLAKRVFVGPAVVAPEKDRANPNFRPYRMEGEVKFSHCRYQRILLSQERESDESLHLRLEEG